MLYQQWTSHIKDPNEKFDFEKSIFGSRRILDRLRQLLKEEENSLEASELSVASFDSPNWAYKQAYKNGYRSCLNVLKKLIDLDQQENTNDDRNVTRRSPKRAAAN